MTETATLTTHDTPAAGAAARMRAVGRAFVPTLIAIGLVTSVVSALGAPLIPTLAAEYHQSLQATQWSLTAPMLVGAMVSPLVGRLGDGPHRRAVLIACLAIVTAGGAIAALAPGLWVLVAGRALQGVGLALMPLTMASAREHLGALRAGEVIATLSVVAAVGVGLGYPITGFVADHGGAAGAFWLGTAASAVCLVLAARYVPRPAARAAAGPLDWWGAVTIGGGVLALLLAFERATDGGWTSPGTLTGMALAVALLAVATRRELRIPAPLVELRLLRHPGVLAANVTALVLGTAMYLGISLMTQLVQLPIGMGESVFVAGLCLVPLSVTSLTANRMVPLVAATLGPRAVIPLGTSLLAAALAYFGVLADTAWKAGAAMGLVGLGVGFTFAAMPSLIVKAVPLWETASAMSFYQVARYLGFSFGAGLAVTLLRVFGDKAVAPGRDAYAATCVTGGVLCLVAGAICWVLTGRTGTEHAGDQAAG